MNEREQYEKRLEEELKNVRAQIEHVSDVVPTSVAIYLAHERLASYNEKNPDTRQKFLDHLSGAYTALHDLLHFNLVEESQALSFHDTLAQMTRRNGVVFTQEPTQEETIYKRA